MRFIDLTGERFGRLVVTSLSEPIVSPSRKSTAWNCLCDCGSTIKTTTSNLRAGNTKSCGCLKLESAPHNKSHGMSREKLYFRWVGMRQRCENRNHKGYALYGGRGIKVCERWKVFENFLTDMGEPPSDEYSIDRIDSDGDYEPSNCRWATSAEQSRNTRRNVLITADGKTMTITDWEKEKGVKPGVFHRRHSLGWPDHQIVNQPVFAGLALRSRK